MIIEYGNLWWFDASVVPKPQRYEVLAKMVSNQLDENVIVQSKDGNQNRKTAFIFMPPSTLHGLGWATCKHMLDYLPLADDPKCNGTKIWYNDPHHKPGIKDWKSLPDIKTHLKLANTMEQATSMMQLPTNDLKNSIDQIFLPLYLCAINKNCIAPLGSALACNNDKYLRIKQVKSENHDQCPKKYSFSSKLNYNDCLCESACHRFDQSLVNLVVGNFYKFDKRVYTMRGLLFVSGEIGEGNLEMRGWQHPDDVMDIRRTG